MLSLRVFQRKLPLNDKDSTLYTLINCIKTTIQWGQIATTAVQY